MKKIILSLLLLVSVSSSLFASNRGACGSYMETIDKSLTKADYAVKFNNEVDYAMHLSNARKYFYYLVDVCEEKGDDKKMSVYFDKINDRSTFIDNTILN